MSSMPSSAADRPRQARASASGRAAIVAAVLTGAIVAIILIAHAASGRGAAGSSASKGGASMSMSSSGGSMGMSSPSAMAMPAAAFRGVPTVSGASLPAIPTSSSAPMAMAMVPLGQSVWDGMRIQARTSAPATFELFDGQSQQLVKPTAKDSFHLMVTLADAQSNYAIPYSSVWATVRKSGRIVFDERLWPMVSRYMGPHYGINVALPGAGLYKLTLLVSPPVAARHIEYKGLWLKPHRVTMAFRWVPKS